jgi:hypothetical protein
MGARAQVEVKMWGGNPSVFLYTHWDSYELPTVVAEALASDAGRARGTDNEYLARIIFCRMVGDDTTGETGYGIGTAAHSDLDYPPIVVDPNEATVTHEETTYTYADFIERYLAPV